MIIIVESGATKTDWCAAALDKEPINVKTAGMNLATMPQDVIEGIVAEAMAEFKAKGLDSKVSEVHFYAAGLIVPEGEKVPPQAKGLDHVLRSLFLRWNMPRIFWTRRVPCAATSPESRPSWAQAPTAVFSTGRMW